MKKIALASVLSVITFYNSAFAEAPKVSLKGRLDTMIGAVSQKKPYMSKNPSQPDGYPKFSKGGIVNDTTLDINVDGRMSSDFTYGGFIRLHADTSVATNKETTVGDKTMVYLQHDKVGRLEAGNMPGAHANLEMDISNFAVGSWGVDGFAAQWLNDRSIQTTKRFSQIPIYVPLYNINTVRDFLPDLNGVVPETRSLEFITYANLPSNYSGRYYSDAPKVNLYTKPVPELTIGFTYIPNMDGNGTLSGRAPKNGGPIDERGRFFPASFRNIFGLGVGFDKKFDKTYSFKTMVAGEIGKAKLKGIRDLKAYEIGFMMGIKEFRFGATYGSWTRSLTLKEKQPNSKQGSTYWSLGFGQSIDKFSYSLTFLNTRKAGGIESLVKKMNADAKGAVIIPNNVFSDSAYNKFRNLVLDVDYKLAPGLLPYASISTFRFKEAAGYKDSGYVALIGTRLQF